MAIENMVKGEHISLANKKFENTPGLKNADDALDSLADLLPGDDDVSIIAKAAALDRLYGTYVVDIYRASKHVEEVLSKGGKDFQNEYFVDNLARVEVGQTDGKYIRYISFASKYAHFFIDGNSFPMYDFYADRMLKYHVGRKHLARDKEHPYRAYSENFFKLKNEVEKMVTVRQLDHYLWVAGQYDIWRIKRDEPSKYKDRHINGWLRKMFEAGEFASFENF